MKKFFNEDDKDNEKEKGKIIDLTFGIDFEDIKNNFENVDMNGEEKDKEEDTTEKNKEPEKIDNDSKKKNIHLQKANALFFPLMILLIGISNLLVIIKDIFLFNKI